MAKHQTDLQFCRKQPGISVGRLCEKCDGKCVICDSFVRPHVLVHVCDDCNYGRGGDKCVLICSAEGVADAYYYRGAQFWRKIETDVQRSSMLGALGSTNSTSIRSMASKSSSDDIIR